MKPDQQPAPKRVVCSRSILFVIQATKVHQQMTKQTVFVMIGGMRNKKSNIQGRSPNVVK